MPLDPHVNFGRELRRHERLGFALVVRLGDDFVAVVLHLEFEPEVTNSNEGRFEFQRRALDATAASFLQFLRVLARSHAGIAAALQHFGEARRL